MKVSKDVTEVIVESVVANCVKREGHQSDTVKLAVENVIHYTNRLNRDLRPDQTVYDNMNLSDVMFPSGLASLLWPRRVQFDVNNRLQSNLIDKETFTDEDVQCHKFVKVNDGQDTKWKKEVVADYSYSNFLIDLTLIKVAMRCSELQLNTSVLQAIRDVDVLSVVDKLECSGRVKWSGAMGSEFIPVRLVSEFNLGLVEDEYFVETNVMLKSLFATQVKDFFTK